MVLCDDPELADRRWPQPPAAPGEQPKAHKESMKGVRRHFETKRGCSLLLSCCEVEVSEERALKLAFLNFTSGCFLLWS